MVIKTLTRKDNVGQLIKYVLADHKIEPDKENEASRKRYYVPDIRLTEQDRKYLNQEIGDSKLLKSFKDFMKHGTLKEFIQSQLLRSPNAKYKDDQPRKLNPVVITQNLRGQTIEKWIQEFNDNEKLRQNPRKGAVQAYHHIVSFNKLDTPFIDEKMVRDITQKFISLRSDKSLVVSTLHQDRSHYHIHFVESGVQLKTGISSRVSKAEYQELKNTMQEYQLSRYPTKLKHSLPEHGKSERAKDTSKMPYKTTDRLGAKVLAGLLESSYKKAVSLEEFLEQIKAAGNEIYYRNGRLQGIKYQGNVKFRFSKLGYDAQKLNELHLKRERAEKELQELQAIRGGGRKSKALEVDRAKAQQFTPTIRERFATLDAESKRTKEPNMLNTNRTPEERQKGEQILEAGMGIDRNEGETKPATKDRLQELNDFRDRYSDAREPDCADNAERQLDNMDEYANRDDDEDEEDREEPDDEEIENDDADDDQYTT